MWTAGVLYAYAEKFTIKMHEQAARARKQAGDFTFTFTFTPKRRGHDQSRHDTETTKRDAGFD